MLFRSLFPVPGATLGAAQLRYNIIKSAEGLFGGIRPGWCRIGGFHALIVPESTLLWQATGIVTGISEGIGRVGPGVVPIKTSVNLQPPGPTGARTRRLVPSPLQAADRSMAAAVPRAQELAVQNPRMITAWHSMGSATAPRYAENRLIDLLAARSLVAFFYQRALVTDHERIGLDHSQDYRNSRLYIYAEKPVRSA